MKILRLDLPAFGPFTDVTLDLSAGHQGLHVIYGPNEAGKTSALRALRNLFFGIDHRTTENFVHKDSSKLRLGAKLEHSDGSTLEFIRLKKTKDALREIDGNTPLDPAVWERFLGGIDPNAFTQRFGIDHAELVRGGREVLEGGGDLGELLLSAGSGISGLQGIQRSLKSEADALFLPRGRNQRIPTSVDQVREAQKQIKALQVTTEEWSRHDEALRSAESKKAQLDARKADLQRELNRLNRFHNAQALLGERKTLLAKRALLDDVVLLPADFTDRRRAAEERLATSSELAAQSNQRIEEWNARIAQEEVDEPLLEAQKEVDGLRERLGEYRKAQADRPNLVSLRQANEHDARDVLEALGRPRDLKEAETLRVRADEPPRIQRLAREAVERESQRDTLRKTIARHRQEIAQLQRDQAALPVTPDLSLLLKMLKLANRQYDLESQHAVAAEQLAARRAAVDSALRRLPGWTGTAEALAALVIPLPETISRFESRFKDAEDTLRLARGEERRARDDIAELEARLASETSQHELPTEEDLRRCRMRRDEGWRLVRRAWLEGKDEPDAVAAFLDGSPPGRTLAESYEEQVTRCDDIADRLRREANEVAQRAERQRGLEGHRVRLSRAALAREEAEAALEGLSVEWGEIVGGLGVGRLEPTELNGWLAQRQKILERIDQEREQNALVERLATQVAEQRARLSDSLAAVGEAPAAEGETLTTLIDRAQDFTDHQKAISKLRDQWTKDLDRLSSGLSQAESELAEVDARRDAWRREWGKWMARIGLGPEDTVEQADVFLEKIHQLDEYLKAARTFERRIQTIDRDADEFTRATREIAARLAPDLAELSPDAIVDQLAQRLRDARLRRQTRDQLTTQIETERKRYAARIQAIEEARRELEALCRDARCDDVAMLPEIETRSAERSSVEEALRQCESRILSLSAGATVESFVAEADAIDFDDLDLRLQSLENELNAIQRDIDSLNQSIGAERNVLATMDGSSRAAAANEQVGYALARLQADVPRYAALRLAAHVLQQGIERHRERHQAPVLQRAGALFARLTLGSFARLAIEENDRGQTVLVGVRPDGETTLGVEAMSDGSCDQLYLALRLASLEIWLKAHEPIPLIVDDILLRFDNPRSIAALRILAELSRLTQVLFFTHHAHLIDLARDHLDADVLFTHELSASSRVAAAAPAAFA